MGISIHTVDQQGNMGIMNVIEIHTVEPIKRNFGTDLTFEAAGSNYWTIYRSKPHEEPPRYAMDRLGRHLERWYEETFGGRAKYRYEKPREYRYDLVALNARIERRDSEPGCPTGWYYVGPEAPDGELAGDRIEDAARLAAEKAQSQ